MALIEEDAFRELLIYCELRLQRTILSRRSLARYIEKAYVDTHAKVVFDLQGAITRVNLSFDLWTLPGRRLLLLGVVTHYLNAEQQPRNVLLALLRMYGSYTATNIAKALRLLCTRFDL
jgi:hypothetical protein